MKNLSGAWKTVAAVVVACAAAVGAGAIGARSVGANANAMAANRPPVVVVVDIDEVMKNLEERKQMELALQKKADDLKKKLEGLQTQAEAKKAEFDAAADPVTKGKLSKQLNEMALRARFEMEFGMRQVTEEGLQQLKELFLKIDGVVERSAKQNRYDIVLASDEKAVIPNDEQEMKRVMREKMMLYVDPSFDITQDIILMMNNEFAAGN